MSHIISRVFWAVVILATVIVAGCGAATPEDIQPVVTPEAQTAPTPAPTATATPEPTPAELRTEIIEPVSPVSPPEETPTTMPALQAAPSVPGSEAPLAAARAALADNTGQPPDQIKVISVEAVDWSDTSLGCPKEGFMYAQVITPGYKIVLEVQGQQYEYHTDRTGQNVVLCQP